MYQRGNRLVKGSYRGARNRPWSLGRTAEASLHKSNVTQALTVREEDA